MTSQTKREEGPGAGRCVAMKPGLSETSCTINETLIILSKHKNVYRGKRMTPLFLRGRCHMNCFHSTNIGFIVL
jgi:hypothetical protein